jgi:cytochrome c5
MRGYFNVYLLLLSLISFSTHSESHRPQDFLKSVQGSMNEGEQIYSHFCSNCHAQKPLIALGAPRFEEEVDWTSRLKQGVDVLLEHTEEGFNAMPPRGGCFECTDEQLALSIVAMVPKKVKKDLLNDLEDHLKNKK